TSDGGRTWNLLTEPALKNGLPTDRLRRIGIAISAQHPKLALVLLRVVRGIAHAAQGRFGGVFRSADAGGTWTQVDDLQAIAPYQICGGLQDNGVWCGPSGTRDEIGVTDADWYPVHGGAGMWVQSPPNDPWTVYSGWQFGNVSRFDLRTWKRDDIQPAALDAGAESGYDFTWDWTTPILISAFDSTTVYLGGNRLFRLRQHGQDWETLGPDMTRTPRENPAPEAGHTSYHAIFSIAESPKSPAVLWTGTDDGFVWVSQDTGRTWTNVTGNFPRGAATACWVSTIVASMHAQGTVWLTYDCHFRDDYRPHVWRSTDFGRTWT